MSITGLIILTEKGDVQVGIKELSPYLLEKLKEVLTNKETYLWEVVYVGVNTDNPKLLIAHKTGNVRRYLFVSDDNHIKVETILEDIIEGELLESYFSTADIVERVMSLLERAGYILDRKDRYTMSNLYKFAEAL